MASVRERQRRRDRPTDRQRWIARDRERQTEISHEINNEVLVDKKGSHYLPHENLNVFVPFTRYQFR